MFVTENYIWQEKLEVFSMLKATWAPEAFMCIGDSDSEYRPYINSHPYYTTQMSKPICHIWIEMEF